MAKKTSYKGPTSRSKKKYFNSNLYEKNRHDPDAANNRTDKAAYLVYRVCTVLFAIMMIVAYANHEIQKATIYLVFLCVSVYLIFIYHKKTGK